MWDYEYIPGKKESEFNIMSAEIIFKYCNEEYVRLALELGAGTGQLSYLLLKKYLLSFAWMIDKSDSSIKYIKQYFIDRGLKPYHNFHALKMDIKNIDIKQGYDLVFSSGLIEHFKGSKQGYICELHKMVSSKYVVCIVPNATAENIALSKTERNIQQYGYEKSMSMEELDYMFVDDQFKKIHGQTFYKNEKLLIGVYERCE